MPSLPCLWSRLPIVVLCAASVSLGKVPIALSQPKSPSWSQTVNSQQLPVTSETPTLMTDDWSLMTELPCLDSSHECIEQLTIAAIANSPELVTLDEQIALVNERVELMGARIDYTSSKRWTNYLTTDPLRLVANIFGGGDNSLRSKAKGKGQRAKVLAFPFAFCLLTFAFPEGLRLNPN